MNISKIGDVLRFIFSERYFKCPANMMVADRTMLRLVSYWGNLLSSEDEEDWMKLRLSKRTGRPFGDDEFAEKVKNLTGRDPRPRRPGRPRKGE